MTPRFKKSLKRIALGLATLMAAVLILAGALVTWVITNPSGAWRFAEKYLLPKDLKVTWEEIHFRTEWKTWRSFDIEWSAENLLVKKGEPLVDAPVTRSAVDFELKLFTRGPNFSVRNIEVQADSPIIFRPPPPTEEKKPESFFQTLKGYLGYLDTAQGYAVLDQIRLDLKELKILPQDPASRPVVLELRAQRTRETQNLVDFLLRLKEPAPPTLTDLEVKGQMDFQDFNRARPFVKAQLRLEGDQMKLEGPWTLEYAEETAKLLAQLEFSYFIDKKKLNSTATLNAAMTEREIELTLLAAVGGIPGPVPRIEKLRAHLNVPLEDGAVWAEKASKVRIWAPISLRTLVDKSIRRSIEVSCKCAMPNEITMNFEGEFWPGHLFEPKPELQRIADLKLTADAVKNKLFALNLKGMIKIDREKGRWLFSPYADSDIRFFSFQALRQFVDSKDVMIPAPFDVLEGHIDLSARGPVALTYKDEKLLQWEFPANLDTQLGSKHQEVKVRAEARVQTSPDFKRVHLILKTLIDKFRIELPPLDPLRGIPEVVRDSRIQMRPKPRLKKTGVEFTFDVDVATVTPGAIQLLYKLADPYVPLSLSFKSAGPKDAGGWVQVEPFNLKYLRRTLAIEKVRIDLQPAEDGGFPLAGLLRMDQTNYKIGIQLSGTTARPQILLSSDPYLSRTDIISVILYDRVSDQLAGADAETAGGVQAAMADRAIGLLGLYAFSTTPIRSFSYNSVTKVYTATVVLSDGLTAGVGTDWENATHLEVRKRVSRRWVLTASWNPSSETRADSGSVVLQWERRF